MIQAAWTFEGLQSIGFTYGIAPLLKQVYPDPRERAKVVGKYLDFFNSHPYMSTAILGATASLELAEKRENRGTPEQLKNTVSGPLAAIGDALFWTGLKPLFSIIAVIASFLGYMAGPLIFLVLFNAFHIWMRIVGFIQGLHHGFGLVRFVDALKLPELTRFIKQVTTILLGVFSACFLFFLPNISTLSIPPLFRMLAVCPFFCVYLLIKRRVPVLVQIYVYSVAVLAFFLLWG
ncbi:MAG: PTS system mannose/fructose/sorbose family transporter subunit IID [Deltaproteobacteria bacterium]|nr:PTS system mannose/fructose/sorbose family transporter subunit IID [Candidatus Zymogenaceae bacterium]